MARTAVRLARAVLVRWACGKAADSPIGGNRATTLPIARHPSVKRLSKLERMARPDARLESATAISTRD